MKRKEPKDVLRIVADYLVDHGYDGLCSDMGGAGCGCSLPDLAPCDGIEHGCTPAYNHPVTAKRNKCGIWMTTKKPGRRKA